MGISDFTSKVIGDKRRWRGWVQGAHATASGELSHGG